MTRIISGQAGSLRLEVPKSGTRPTSDRVREAVFSTLESWGFVTGTRVLDLYAGSGALGLEAASRGAATVTLVEKHQQAAQVAKRNAATVTAAFTTFTAEAPRIEPPRIEAPRIEAPRIEVVRSSVQSFLAAAAEQTLRPQWDVAFLDPPYDLPETELSANLTALAPLLAADAAVLVERSSRSPEPEWPAGLERIREKRYGETVLWWAEPAGH